MEMDNDKKLLRELYYHRETCVNSLLIKTNCDHDQAENIFIEAVFTFRKKKQIGSLPTKKLNTRAYLIGICYKLWQKQYEREKKFKDSSTDIAQYFYEYLPNHINSESARSYKENLLVAIQESLISMGQKCRKIIRLYYYEEKSMTEIAEIMEFNTPVVATSTKYRCFKEFKDKAFKMIKKVENSDF